MKCSKAIIPVAGYGTRRLPVTKTVEKCMLPLGNRPVIDYVVRDCVAAGITDIYFVVSGSAEQLRSYYGRNIELEDYLKAKGKDNIVSSILPPKGVRFHYVEQDMLDGRYGTTIPVWLCRHFVEEDELVLVVMGDDVTYNPGKTSDIERLVELEKPAILGVPMSPEDLSRYGALVSNEQGIFKYIMEKPAPGTAPSNVSNVSKYVLPGSVMKYAYKTIRAERTTSGEYYITDVINDMVADGVALTVIPAEGHYLDTGSLEAWVQANVWLLENDKV